MKAIVRISSIALALLSGTALADATAYTPRATGFSLPNAQQAVSATTAQSAVYATTAGSTGYATTAGSATSATNATYAASAGSAKTANSATTADSADSATYANNAGIAQQAAGLTAGNNCPAGSALSVTRGVLGCVSSVTSITGQLNGSQIVGNITNVGAIRTSGNITAGGNLTASGSVNGIDGVYSSNGVYASNYYGRGGGANANFNGNSDSATTAGSTSYAASSNVGILRQHGSSGDGSSFYCDSGYSLKFYDLNVDSTNNAFFYQCIQNGH